MISVKPLAGEYFLYFARELYIPGRRQSWMLSEQFLKNSPTFPMKMFYARHDWYIFGAFVGHQT